IDFFANPAILAIDEVLDLGGIRPGHGRQIAEPVIGVCGRLTAAGFTLQLTIGSVGIGRGAILEQTILGVIGASQAAIGASVAQPVAVAVVGICGDGAPVPLHGDQSACSIVRIVVSGRLPIQCFALVGKASQEVVGILHSNDVAAVESRPIARNLAKVVIGP